MMRRDVLTSVSGLSLIVGGTSLGTASSQRDDWPMYRGDAQNSGSNLNTTPPRSFSTPAAAGFLGNKWEFQTQERVSSSPIVADGSVFASTEGGTVYALEQESGEMIWQKTLRDDVVTSPAYSNGRIFITTWDGRVLGIDARDGSTEWEFDFSPIRENLATISTSPIVLEDRLYVAESRGIVSLNIEDGSLAWAQPTDISLRTEPAVMRDNVVVTGRDSQVDNATIAFDLGDGSRRWRSTHPEVDPQGIACTRSRAFVVGESEDRNSCRVAAIHGGSGEDLWEYEAETESISSPAISENYIYFSNRDDSLFCLNRSNGELQWRLEKDRYIGVPSVIGSTVIISNSGGFTAVDATDGTVNYSDYVGAFASSGVPTQTAPVGSDRKLYSGGSRGIYCWEGLQDSWTEIFGGVVGLGVIAYANKRIRAKRGATDE